MAFAAVPWYVVGATYGELLWLASALPALLLLAARVPTLCSAALVMAVEALVAAAVGLLCAYVWHRAG